MPEDSLVTYTIYGVCTVSILYCAYSFFTFPSAPNSSDLLVENIQNFVFSLGSKKLFLLDDQFVMCPDSAETFGSMLTAVLLKMQILVDAIAANAKWASSNPDSIFYLRDVLSQLDMEFKSVVYKFYNQSFYDFTRLQQYADTYDIFFRLNQELNKIFIDHPCLAKNNPKWEPFLKLSPRLFHTSNVLLYDAYSVRFRPF